MIEDAMAGKKRARKGQPAPVQESVSPESYVPAWMKMGLRQPPAENRTRDFANQLR
jgi:hypothetical protein